MPPEINIRTSPRSPRLREGQQVRADFLSRKTLADCVKINMTLANRRTYYQRVIFVAKHAEPAKEFNAILEEFFREKLSIAEKYSHGENISGLIMLYEGYSVYMFEGSEEALGPFFRMLSSREKEIFVDTKIILIFNNMNLRFFKKIVWCSADPPVLLETTLMENVKDIQLQSWTVLKKIYNLCRKLQVASAQSLLYRDDEKLDASYNKLLPEIALIDALIATKYLPSISQMATLYEAVPHFCNYDSKVWPIPFSYCPNNVFASDEYEVSLTFHKDSKKLN